MKESDRKKEEVEKEWGLIKKERKRQKRKGNDRKGKRSDREKRDSLSPTKSIRR